MNGKENTSEHNAAVNYFSPRIYEEDLPLKLSEYLNIKYYHIEKIFNLYYQEDSLSIAKESSLSERNNKKLKDSSFVYGEITFRSIAYIIEYLKSEFSLQKGNFFDLGSGSGKGILAASLVYPFPKCVGIEYLHGLNQLGLEMIKYHSETFPEIFKTNTTVFEGFKKIPELHCLEGDFLKFSWEEASLILANSTCFSSELLTAIGLKADQECKVGTIIVTFSKTLFGLSTDWTIMNGFRRLMTWGIATVYIHIRKTKKDFDSIE